VDEGRKRTLAVIAGFGFFAQREIDGRPHHKTDEKTTKD
jgi:hypothetical protein